MQKTVKVALSGYATMDCTGRANAQIALDGTTPVTISRGEWPRPGGAPLYAGKVLAEAGHEVSIIAEVGDDRAGTMFLAHLGEAGLVPTTVSVRSASRTPACILIHQDDGKYCCFLDRGDDEIGSTLSSVQTEAIIAADWVVIAAGPAELSAQVLDLLLPQQKLAWIFKSDELSFPASLCRSLWKRASVVFCNQHERIALETADCSFVSDAVIFETHGEAGVRVHFNNVATTVSTEEHFVVDATGAGDTFAGGALSVLFQEGTTPVEAAEGGLKAAAGLLRARLGSGIEGREKEGAAEFATVARKLGLDVPEACIPGVLANLELLTQHAECVGSKAK